VRFQIDGVRVGHWTDAAARTGCTVVLFPDGTVASGEVRGGAPATREFDLLAPGRTVDRIDALVLSGGSAFGLAAADGVMAHLEAAGVGYPTGAGPVPIVVGLSLFDLLEGDGSVRPGPAEGRAASEVASEEVQVGRVGAGTGAMVGTWRGRGRARPGGIGMAVVRRGDLVVVALLAVNAAGDVGRSGISEAIADGTFVDWPEPGGELFDARGNTTIGMVVSNASVGREGCLLMAGSAHDGLARAVFPPHTRSDGDALVAAATGVLPTSDVDLDVLRAMTVAAVERAVTTACGPGGDDGSAPWLGTPSGR
jgi:L-aminopeptidase/D-esterase-like protein